MIDTRIGLNTLIAAVATLALAAPVRAGGRSKKNAGKGPKTTRPVLGSPKAKVKIVVYGDMQCPYTKRLMTRTLPRLVRDYPKKVQIVWRDNPLSFHRGALPAAVAGREVFQQRGSKAFFAFQRLVFTNMRQIDATNLAAWAKQVGADSAKVAAALNGTAHRAWINKDQQSAVSRQATGTPTSFVNGRKVRGSQPYQKFKILVDSL